MYPSTLKSDEGFLFQIKRKIELQVSGSVWHWSPFKTRSFQSINILNVLLALRKPRFGNQSQINMIVPEGRPPLALEPCIGLKWSPPCGCCNCALSTPCPWPLTLYPLTHPCVVAYGREIWNLTVEPNSNYANVSWKHNFPAGSSEFVLEFTLDSKKPDQTQRVLLNST